MSSGSAQGVPTARSGDRFGPAGEIRVLAFDVFGTTVDWWTGVSEQIADVARAHGVELDAGLFADEWRGRYLPSLAAVNEGHRPWVYLDALHRESLDEMLAGLDAGDALDDAARRQLVGAWHRLPPWSDAADGLARLSGSYITVAFSNGGFRLLTDLVKHNGLDFDAIVSAENAQVYKPAAGAYLHLSALLDTPPEGILMVACHRWDLDAARNAGLRTAFVHRPGEKGPNQPADSEGPADCDLTVANFGGLADALGC